MDTVARQCPFLFGEFMKKTTNEDFKYFVHEAEYWIDRFHLREWRFHFIHEAKNDNTFAWYFFNWKGRTVTIGMNINWGSEVKKKEISKSAFHEVCEVLLSDMETNAGLDRCPSEKDELVKSKHSIIRRMEWAIWEPYYNK